MAPPQIFGEVLGILWMGSLEGDFITLIRLIYVHDIALLGEFDAVFVRELVKAPEEDSLAAGAAVMKGVGAALLADVLDIHVSRPAQGLDGLVQNCSRAAGILLIHG